MEDSIEEVLIKKELKKDYMIKCTTQINIFVLYLIKLKKDNI